MTTYCFRAEAAVDIGLFFQQLDRDGIHAENARFETDPLGPETGGVCDFDSAAGIDQLVASARHVVDGHVIVRTLRAGSHREHDMDDVREG